MAKDDELQVKESEKKGSMATWQKGLIVVAIIAAAWTLLVEDDAIEDVRDRSQQRFAPAEQAADSASSGQTGSTNVGAVDPLAALAALTKKVEMLQRSNDELKRDLTRNSSTNERIAALQKEISEVRNTNSELAQRLVNQGDQVIERERQRVIDGTNSSDELLFNLEGIPTDALASDSNPFSSAPSPLAPAKPYSPYGENYVVLAPRKDNPETERFNIPNPFAAARPNPNDPAANPAGPSSTQGVAAASEAPNEPVENTVTIDIPAYSFVSAELLHGVSCPVGGAQPGVDSAIPGQPTVLPIRGVFKGPNGDLVDLGTAHLFGFCSGRITKTNSEKDMEGRGEIKVEYISYWDNYGKPQHIPVQGYIVSEKDNHKGVAGIVDRVSRSYLADQSVAAGMAAAATGVSSSQFSQLKDSREGTSATQFTGDLGLSAAAQGVAALWNEIAEQFRAEAASAFDSVVLNPGERIKIMTVTPFSVTNPKERPEETIYDAYDVLI